MYVCFVHIRVLQIIVFCVCMCCMCFLRWVEVSLYTTHIYMHTYLHGPFTIIKTHGSEVMWPSSAIHMSADHKTMHYIDSYVFPVSHGWPCGPMDKASDYESGDSRFKSWQGRLSIFLFKYRSLENFRPDLFRCKIFSSK